LYYYVVFRLIVVLFVLRQRDVWSGLIEIKGVHVIQRLDHHNM